MPSNSSTDRRATALDHAIDDYLAANGSTYYLIGMLTGAIKHSWTMQETADHLTMVIPAAPKAAR